VHQARPLTNKELQHCGRTIFSFSPGKYFLDKKRTTINKYFYDMKAGEP
jgi:hypothetical protein